MINITIRSIPEAQHRYPTTGDWWFEPDGSLQIAVTEWGHPDHEFLIAFHELVEVWLCRRRGITTEAVDAFDMAYERDRADGDIRLRIPWLRSPALQPSAVGVAAADGRSRRRW